MIVGLKPNTFVNANREAERAIANNSPDLIGRLFTIGTPVLTRILKDNQVSYIQEICNSDSSPQSKEEIIYECYYTALMYVARKYRIGGNFCSVLYQKTKCIMIDRYRSAQRKKIKHAQFLEHMQENPEDAF